MNRKKRIALFTSVPENSSGVAQYIIAILDALASLDPKRYSVRVWPIFPHWAHLAAGKGLRAEPVRLSRYQRIAERLSRIDKRLAAVWSFFHPVRLRALAWRADMVLIPESSALDLPCGTRLVAAIHDLMHLHEPQFPEVGAPEMAVSRNLAFQAITRLCDGILVDSEIGKKHVLDAYGAEASRVYPLPYIANEELKTIPPAMPENFPSELEGGYLFYPAQFWMHKNHVRLVEAVAMLVPELDVHCVFTGDMSKNGFMAFKEAVARYELQDRVHCLGYVSQDELAWLYIHARCMIMPTFFGPTNIPPLEAMHFGCPVGISGIYGMPEQLGDAALFFDPKNVDTIANVIRRLWSDEDLRGECIRKGYAVSQERSFENFSRRVAEVVADVLESSPCRRG